MKKEYAAKILVILANILLLLKVSGHLRTTAAMAQLCSHMHAALEAWPWKKTDRKLGAH